MHVHGFCGQVHEWITIIRACLLAKEITINKYRWRRARCSVTLEIKYAYVRVVAQTRLGVRTCCMHAEVRTDSKTYIYNINGTLTPPAGPNVYIQAFNCKPRSSSSQKRSRSKKTPAVSWCQWGSWPRVATSPAPRRRRHDVAAARGQDPGQHTALPSPIAFGDHTPLVVTRNKSYAARVTCQRSWRRSGCRCTRCVSTRCGSSW
jgi:hypothetical protein